MLKKNARIVASDEGNRVEIIVRVSSKNGLTRGEVAKACRRIAKGAASVIPDAPYVNLDEIDTRIEF